LNLWERAQGKFDHTDCRDKALEKQVEALKRERPLSTPVPRVRIVLDMVRQIAFR